MISAHAMAEVPPPSTIEELYHLHRAAIYRFCLSQLRDHHLAEDAAADVFAVALRNSHRLHHEDGALFWLLTIARRVTGRHRRSLLRWGRLTERAGTTLELQSDIHDQVVIRHELRRVIDTMGTMSKRDRVLIGLRLAAQLSYAEIAEMQTCSEGAARVATHRALKILRARLEVER
jgi:RNA polymerase sigma-70 factor (ECF subfamily)